MNRMARIVLDPNRTYAGTRTAVQLCGSQCLGLFPESEFGFEVV